MGEHPIISAGYQDINVEETRESDVRSSSSSSSVVDPSAPLLGLTHHQPPRASRVVATLVSLLVLGLLTPTLAVPTKMQHHRETLQVSHEGGTATLRDDELENIRRSIVEGLGLERIPDPSKANVSQTEYERAHGEYLSRLQMSRAPGDRRRRRLHTFHASEPFPTGLSNRTRRDVGRSLNDSTRLYFPLEIPEDDSSVDHAALRLLLHSDNHQDQVNIAVYRLAGLSRHLVIQETLERLHGPQWIELDITEVVDLWHVGLADNLGLELRLFSSTGANVKLANPVLNVFTTSASHSVARRPRAAPEQLMSLHKGRRTECRGDNKKCCRHQMTVTFKDLKGFEFIVQPKNFDAGYCKGRCPPRYNPAHHHALLQSLIWKEDRRKAPRPCCAPSKLAELEILYFDENDPTKLKVSSWKNMRVLECACS